MTRGGVPMGSLDPAIISLALETMDPMGFEAFGQIALTEVLGVGFEPTGGSHDGGQDGFLRQKQGRPTQFVQISKEKDIRGKVRRTIERLKSSGRDPASVTFLFSESFPTKDELEDEIEKETGVQIRIHDRSWLSLQVAKSEHLKEILSERASATINNLIDIRKTSIQTHTPAERMSVIVYMDAHARSAPQETDLLTVAVDAAIYQALEGTDPDKKIFKTRAEITAAVESRFPAVKRRPSLDIGVRLERLSAKKNNPRVRWYKKEDKYCLPYDVRNELSQENEIIRRLELDFLESVRGRARAILESATSDEIARIGQAVLTALARTFEHQGMNLAASFDSTKELEEVRTYEFVRDEFAGKKGDNEKRELLVDCATRVLREVVYSGNSIERAYMFQLFKLFSVEFVIRGDERVTSYFKSMAKGLRLLVGADIIIRALSETCLKPESRATQNALALLEKAGAHLLITPRILEEVYTHIVAENKEFESYYKSWLPHATPELVGQSDRILIRAFFYSYFEPDRHAIALQNWRGLLELFGSANWFDARGHAEDFSAYLLNKFNLKMLGGAEVDSYVSEAHVRVLKAAILARRESSDILAENDAAAALYVNSYRDRNGERFGTSVYGYHTWWLTEEVQVLEAAKAVRIPAMFAMNPQFLMNFFAASPAMHDLTKGFGEFFPTNFGLRITDRVNASTLKGFLRKANEAARQDEAAAKARMRQLSNELKAKLFAQA